MLRHLIALVATCLSLGAFAAVDVNQASRADLETVKGIGPALSAKILDARTSGQFRNWSDLVDRVGGVGPGNAARFSQAGLTVGGAPFDAAAVPATAKKSRDAAAPRANSRDAAKAETAAPAAKGDGAAPAAKPRTARPAA